MKKDIEAITSWPFLFQLNSAQEKIISDLEIALMYNSTLTVNSPLQKLQLVAWMTDCFIRLNS